VLTGFNSLEYNYKAVDLKNFGKNKTTLGYFDKQNNRKNLRQASNSL